MTRRWLAKHWQPNACLYCYPQRCRLFTCDPSVRHKEMEPSLAAAKTFAKLRVGSGVLRRAWHSSSDNGGSPAAGVLAPPAVVVHGAKQEDPAEVKPAAGPCRKRSVPMPEDLQCVACSQLIMFQAGYRCSPWFRGSETHEHLSV